MSLPRFCCCCCCFHRWAQNKKTEKKKLVHGRDNDTTAANVINFYTRFLCSPFATHFFPHSNSMHIGRKILNVYKNVTHTHKAWEANGRKFSIYVNLQSLLKKALLALKCNFIWWQLENSWLYKGFTCQIKAKNLVKIPSTYSTRS